MCRSCGTSIGGLASLCIRVRCRKRCACSSSELESCAACCSSGGGCCCLVVTLEGTSSVPAVPCGGCCSGRGGGFVMFRSIFLGSWSSRRVRSVIMRSPACSPCGTVGNISWSMYPSRSLAMGSLGWSSMNPITSTSIVVAKLGAVNGSGIMYCAGCCGVAGIGGVVMGVTYPSMCGASGVSPMSLGE